MKQILILAILLVAFASSIDIENYDFDQFIQDYQKSYHNEQEFLIRKNIFNQNIQKIQNHRSNSYKLGINQFLDLTTEEFNRQKLKKSDLPSTHFDFKESLFVESVQQKIKQIKKDLPKSWDWRQQNVLTPVKNQAQCGSCWAFASTAVIESHYAIATGKLEVLSPQQLVSCAPNTDQCGGIGGCQGSIAELAYQFVKNNGGQASEADYPYQSGVNGTNFDCKTGVKSTVSLDGWVKLDENNQDEVMDALVNKGPLAINVDASEWHLYSGGVFDGCSYSKNVDIDHVVVLVGYGTDPQLGDYWIARNSWTDTWGEGGFIRLKRNSLVQCAIDNTPYDGVACKSNPVAFQKVCGTCGMLLSVTYPTGVKSAVQNLTE